jgi:peroxiredoxin
VLSTGDPEKNRRFMQEHGVRCPVLLQRQMEVASTYRVSGTPIGYLIDEGGRITSEMAIGAQALLTLSQATAPAAPVNGKKTPQGNRTLADSKLTRDGLRAGTSAPEFSLPLIPSGEVSLAGYRGKRLLLVFSDPHCGPCQVLAPRLEEVHRRRSDLEILMISRGDREENLAKLREHGLSFPVALQKQWEISLKYGMFATPIGYLIDKAGIITRDVAVGSDAILELASHARDLTGSNNSPSNRKETVKAH